MTDTGCRRCITDLDAQVAALSASDRQRFERVFHLGITHGEAVPPEEMHGWLADYFGSVDAVRRQRIVTITNRVTWDGALFNELRARRPLEAPARIRDLEQTIRQKLGDPFCHPLEGTPADTFGRIRGMACLTASNVAKYDGWHGVIVFDEHHPLHFTAEEVSDYISTAQRWAREAHAADAEALYPFFLWNCLWRSGASILHGHAHMILARGMHYAKVEKLRRVNLAYRSQHGVGYFSDLTAIHESLGLAIEHGGATILPSLTPFKEKETQVIAKTIDDDLTSAIFHVLDAFVSQLGVQSFNLAIYQPPLVDALDDWQDFPVIARLIDRGSLDSNTSDIGAMEIFGQSVVSTDPFRIADALRPVVRPR
jgi:hypothetical protein